MANIVEQGIIIDTLSGAVDAWNFLAAHAVPELTIVRVLLKSAQRRPSDNAFSQGLGHGLGLGQTAPHGAPHASAGHEAPRPGPDSAHS
ncbi:hypothetical protein [Rugamonas sp.]|uniref:hypothetical protein n=1 Tax=Rugamonas sp. TaxID=1926287 RepID=UPI0025D52E6C|nr:hypothetical protein [Rugamonas sp.]